MAKVDPFLFPIPAKIQNDPELAPYFEFLGRWNQDVWRKIGGSADPVSELQAREDFICQVCAEFGDLINRIGSGDFLTSDETGFTVDSDKLSVDMDEA